MEIKINLNTNNTKLLEQLAKIDGLSKELGRAIRDFEIMQKQQNSATVVANDNA